MPVLALVWVIMVLVGLYVVVGWTYAVVATGLPKVTLIALLLLGT